MRVLLACCIALAAASTAAAGNDVHRFDRHRIAFSYPAAWHVTTQPLSNVVNPVYRFAVSTFPAHRTSLDDGPCLQGIARQRGPRGAIAFVQEALGVDRKLSRFPPRPRHFRLPRPDENACVGRGSIEVPFREAGRAFYLWISIGPQANRATRSDLRRILASLRIDRLG